MQVIRAIVGDLTLFAFLCAALWCAVTFVLFPRKTLESVHEHRRYAALSPFRALANIMPSPDSNSPIGIIIVVMSGLIGLAVAGFIGLVLFLAITHQAR